MAPGGPASIRPATEADLPALGALWFEFENWLDGLDDASDPVDRERFSRFEALAFGPDALCTCLIAETEAGPAGYLVYYFGVWMDDLAPCLHVADLFVRPALHRQGIGRALMEEARRIARERGAAHLFWTVWRRNRAAREFYRRLGASIFKEETLMKWPAAPES